VEMLKARLLTRKPKPLSAKSVNNVLTVLGRTLRYAQELELIESIPRIKFLRVPPQRYDFLDFDELHRLVEAAKEEPEALAARLCAAEAGLRAGEVKALKWSSLDLVAGRLTVQQSLCRGHLTSPKGGRMRTIPMTKRLVEALKAIRHLRGDFVFC